MEAGKVAATLPLEMACRPILEMERPPDVFRCVQHEDVVIIVLFETKTTEN